MNHSKQITILSIAVAVLFVSVLFLLYLNFHKISTPISTPTTGVIPVETSTPTVVPTINPTADWKTYINSQYKFSLKHPLDYLVEENIQNDRIQLIFNRGKANSFYVKAEINYLPNQPKYYLDTLSNGTRKIGEITWNTFYLPEGYENIGTQEITPIYAIQLERSSILYSISGFQSEQIPDIIYQILSTFKFTTIPSPTISVSKVTYKLPSGWQTFSGPANQFTVGFNPSTQDASMQDGIVSIVYKNLQNNPYYSPYAQTQLFRVLPYNNGSRHAFIEKQLGETLSIGKGNITSDTGESNMQISGKNCLIINGVYISQFPTVWGMCVIDSTTALMFTSFNYADLSQHLSSLNFK